MMSSNQPRILSMCEKCFKLYHRHQVAWLRQYSNIRLKEAVHPFKWQPVIGLEVHAQIASQSKLFSGAAVKYGGRTNSQVALLDAALPGTLPVLNSECVKAGVATALALGLRVNHLSQFDRKHYFYSDLPAGYQITQQRMPLASGGEFTFIYQPEGPGTAHYDYKTVRFIQLQLEQDSGKSLHDQDAKQSLIDLNRAGTGLMEIVTQPDFRSAEEAYGFIRELKRVLETIGACDGKMEEGSLRVDASISIHKPEEPFGTRVEVKNLNSMKFVFKAIKYEIKRQIDTLENGGAVDSETRNFDVNSGGLNPTQVGDVAAKLETGELSQANAKRVLLLYQTGIKSSVDDIIEEKNLGAISDDDLLSACSQVVAGSPKEVRKYQRDKKERSMNSLIGKVHKVTNKRAESPRIRGLLTQLCLQPA